MPAPPPRPEAIEPAAPPVVPRDGGTAGALASWLAVACLLALLAVAWAGGEVSAPPAALTVLVLFLPHLAVALAIGAFALWVLVPDRRLPPAVLGAVVVLAALRWGPPWRPSPGRGPGSPVALVSWNVQRLWGDVADGKPATCVLGTLRDAAPDVVALLEVTAADTEALAAELDMICRHAPYTGNGPKVGGIAVCSRGDTWRLRSGEGQRFVDTTDWSYLFAEIEGPSAVFNLLAVHLVPYRVGERDLRRLAARAWERGEPDELLAIGDRGARVVRAQSDQSAALLERVRKLRDPTVIAGDFNSTRDTALHVALRRSLDDVWERGGHGFGATIRVFGRIPLRVDHVYASREFDVLGAEVLPAHCSDHQPVLARLVLPDPG